MPALPAPPSRVAAANGAPVRARAGYVLYWMTASRRLRSSFALEHAVARAAELGRPLVVLEALRCGGRWASARVARFVLDGMRANEAAARGRPIAYLPYLEPEPGAGRGLLAALAARAALVVADEFPGHFLPAMTAAAARALDVRLETVDGNGLLPLRAAPAAFPSAYAFRRFLQRTLREHLERMPVPDPLDAPLAAPPELPPEAERRWPRASRVLLDGDARALERLPVDPAVGALALEGGARAGRETLGRFVRERLPRYAEERSQPGSDASSGLSPWLHFGHVGAHEVFAEVARWEGWTSERLAPTAAGKKAGWWGLGASAEAFLDQLVTWRELGFVDAFHRPLDHARYAGLPEWARATLGRHARDRRGHLYPLEELERAATHDEVWNAAQRELRATGRIHNYLRMLWGKKVLEWSASPEAAFDALVELNNRWAIDGRDPNSYSGIAWCLGRFDRPWGPERKIFGTVRYMSSDNTRRKLDLKAYLARWGG